MSTDEPPSTKSPNAALETPDPVVEPELPKVVAEYELPGELPTAELVAVSSHEPVGPNEFIAPRTDERKQHTSHIRGPDDGAIRRYDRGRSQTRTLEPDSSATIGDGADEKVEGRILLCESMDKGVAA